MFILSVLILEVGENLFRIFEVRLVFLLFVFLRVIIKKTRNQLWAVFGQDSVRPGL